MSGPFLYSDNPTDLAAIQTALPQLAANIVVGPSVTGVPSRTAADKFAEHVSVQDYGATGDGVTRYLSSRFATLGAAQAVYPFVTNIATQTLDWAGIMLALSNSQNVYIPAGTYRCAGDAIEITRATRLMGDGPHITHITRNTSGHGIYLNMASATSDTRLDGFELVNTMADGAPTSGAGIYGHLGYVNEVTNLRITNFYDGIHIVQCPVGNYRSLNITTFSRYGFWSEGGNGLDCRMSEFIISGQLLVLGLPTVYGIAGIRLDDLNDEHSFMNGIVNFCQTGLYTDSASHAISACPEFGRFINVSFDSNATGIDLANCSDMVFDACYFSNRPNNGAVIGSRGPTRHVKFIGCTFYSNGGNGVFVDGSAKFTYFIGCSFSANSVTTPSSAHGAVVAGSATDFHFIGCQFDNLWGTGTQNFGLYIASAGCTRFTVTSCTFSSASGASFINSSTASDQNVFGNSGYRTKASGQVTLVAGTRAVTFPTDFPSAVYSLALSSGANETLYWSSKAASGFTVTSSVGASTSVVDWTAEIQQ